MYTPTYDYCEDVEMWTIGKSFGFVQQFYYHLTNQTHSGGCNQFPVANDVVMENLRLYQHLENGEINDVILYDIDGEPMDHLNCSTVFLDSLDIPIFRPSAIESVTLSGRVNVSTLFIQTAFRGEIEAVDIDPNFTMHVSHPLPGVYETIKVKSYDGREFTIGTFGISAVTDY